MSLKLLFTGDMSFTGVYRQKVISGEEIFSAPILGLLQECHYTIANFEGPATDEKNELRQDVYVVSPPQSVFYAAKRGINVFNLANNHTFDCGLKGYLDTLSEIENCNSFSFGAGSNLPDASKTLYLEKHGVRVALVGICHEEGMIASDHSAGVFCETEHDLLKQRISEARQHADWIILNYHGGEEYTTIPMPRRRQLLRDYLKLDVDIIVAHHPHVLQGYEQVGRKTVFYSLGNFVFDIPTHKMKELTDVSALLQIVLTKHDYTFTFIPIKMDFQEGTVLTDAQDLVHHLQRLSNFGNYQRAWLADAHRAFFQPSVKAHGVSNEVDPPTKPKRLSLLRFLSPKFYATIYKLLRGRNSRPIFLGALQFSIMRRLKLRMEQDKV
jgi:poly-gamma-glutamate synthesis protein (capsule biosynthesis protein)